MRRTFTAIGVVSGSVVDATQGRVHGAPLERGQLAAQVAAALLDRALDELGDALDGIANQLRPRWDAAAAVVRAAVEHGRIASSTTAEQILLDDESGTRAEHWRALPAAVADLDDIEDVLMRALFVTGAPMRAGERARAGRAAWLDASHSRPVALVEPSKRAPIAKVDLSKPDRGRRAGVAEQLERERVTTQAASAS